jgi:hypothetical protein
LPTNKHTGKSISQNQVEISQSKSRHIVGTHIVLFFNQHGLYRANLKTHKYKRPANNTGTIHNFKVYNTVIRKMRVITTARAE